MNGGQWLHNNKFARFFLSVAFPSSSSSRAAHIIASISRFDRWCWAAAAARRHGQGAEELRRCRRLDERLRGGHCSSHGILLGASSAPRHKTQDVRDRPRDLVPFSAKRRCSATANWWDNFHVFPSLSFRSFRPNLHFVLSSYVIPMLTQFTRHDSREQCLPITFFPCRCLYVTFIHADVYHLILRQHFQFHVYMRIYILLYICIHIWNARERRTSAV